MQCSIFTTWIHKESKLAKNPGTAGNSRTTWRFNASAFRRNSPAVLSNFSAQPDQSGRRSRMAFKPPASAKSKRMRTKTSRAVFQLIIFQVWPKNTNIMNSRHVLCHEGSASEIRTFDLFFWILVHFLYLHQIQPDTNITNMLTI